MLPWKRILIWLIFFSISASAQHPLVINYGKKDGLPSFETYDVMQDSEGFIWIPTDCGVIKYDGYHFKVFNTESGLRNNCVFKIYEDHLKRKWLTTSTNELCYIEDDKVVYLPCSDAFAKMAGPFAAKRLIVDKDENVYISHRGVSCYYKISPPYKDISNSRIFLDQTVGYGYVEEIGKDFLYGTNGNFPYDKNHHYLQLRKGRNIYTVNVQEEFSSQIFATPVGDGSYLYSEGKYLFRITNDSAYLVRKFDKLIISITVSNNEVWIGHYRGGVSKYDLNGFRFISTFLPEYSVSGSCFDSEKNLWLSTLESGIFSIPPIGTKYLNVSNGLSLEHILTANDIDGKLAVGTYDGKIRFVEDEKVSKVIEVSDHLANVNYSILPYHDLIFWGGGTGAYLIKNEKIKTQIYSKLVRSASIWRHKIFMGSVNEIVVYEKSSIKVLGSLNSRLTRLMCDKSGVLWIGTSRGLMIYRGDSIVPHEKFNKVFQGKVTDLIQSRDGTIWIGTNGKGIIRYKNGELEHFPHAKGDDIVNCMYSDPVTDNIWVATTQGVYLIDPVRLTKVKVLTLKRYSFEITSIVRIKDLIYLCTTKGVFIVEADKMVAEPQVPSLYLSAIEAGDKTFLPGDDVHLPYSEARIRFTFKPITFIGIPTESFKYRLEGGDGKWHYTDNNSVEYGFLKPGKYKFTVVSVDDSGHESIKTADFSFSVLSPFYLKTWFIVLVIIGIFVLLSLAGILLIRYSRKKEKIRNDNEVKLADLELKALRSQMNPHFIFNSLNAVQGLILRNDSDGALTFMGKFSRLVRGVLENSEKPLIPLTEEVAGLNLYLQLEQLKYDHIFNYSIVIDEEIIPNQIFLPSMLIQPLVENAIQHGVVASDRKGNIKVTFKLESESILLVVVEDNGVGFSSKKQKRAEERISLGMRVTNERLKLLEKRMLKRKESSSEISVNSVLGGGTAVYLKIPIYGKTSDAGYTSR